MELARTSDRPRPRPLPHCCRHQPRDTQMLCGFRVNRHLESQGTRANPQTNSRHPFWSPLGGFLLAPDPRVPLGVSTPFGNGCGAEGVRPGGPGLGGEQVRVDFTVHRHYLRPQRRVPSLTNAAVVTFSSKIQLKWGGRCTWSVAQCQLGSPVQATLPLPWSQSLKASQFPERGLSSASSPWSSPEIRCVLQNQPPAIATQGRALGRVFGVGGGF